MPKNKKGKKGKSKKTKTLPNLPNRILVLDNVDKGFQEKWTEGRNMLNIPHSYRCIMVGRPNSGKSLFAKNMLIRANPPFERLIVIHPEGEDTKEYDDCSPDAIIDYIPPPTAWEDEDGETPKTLCIIDDIDFQNLGKEQSGYLYKLFSYVSSHKSISIILTTQDYYVVSPQVRRQCNVIVMWRSRDMRNMKSVASKIGITPQQLQNLVETNLTEYHDSLMFDFTNRTPYPLRKNGFERIAMPN